MLELVIVILGASFVLYTLLGGADFGAGIIETLEGTKGERTISKAIAPVWEANHVWLILAVVILFTGFPAVYATLSLVLHIPLMIVLLGIILRGTAFTFRHYDVIEDRSHSYYSTLFKLSSFLTPLFLGITLGAMILGRINVDTNGRFYKIYIWPWLNIFCFMMGIFSACLFSYIASVFLIGEAKTHIQSARYSLLTRRCLIYTILSGVLVFLAATWEGHGFTTAFFNSPVSIFCLVIALAGIAVMMYALNKNLQTLARAAVGLQVSAVVTGWFAIQYPVMINISNGQTLTFQNAKAPDATLYQLLIALAVGLLLIVPALLFLFRVFKRKNSSRFQS
jgi:cytochrome d ubiquinol oxidase subunit II